MAEARDNAAWIADLVVALRTGEPINLADGEDVDVNQAVDWPVDRRLPGEALRAALLTPDVRPDPRGLKIRAAYITGSTDFADLRLPYTLRFNSCAFELLADWSRLTVASLDLISCSTPSLKLAGAHIEGLLNLTGLVATEVIAKAVTIKGGLNLQGATLTNKGGAALTLDAAEIKGGAFLNPMTVVGEVRAVGAAISDQLNLSGATLTNEGKDALTLDRADIKGNAFLNPVTVTGKVRAVGAVFGGQLNLQGAKLTNEAKDALNLDAAHIKGVAFLNPVTVTGEVRAVGAVFGGQLNLQGATLINEGNDALTLDRAQVKGSAFLTEVTATGAVRAFGATVSGVLDLEGTELTRENGVALNLQSTQLGRLKLVPAVVKGTIALDAAQIAELETPEKEKMTVLTDNELAAAGWRVGDVKGGIRRHRESAANWLNRTNATDEFVAQPWHELANLYEHNGQPADARWMRWKAAKGVTRTSRFGPKLIRWVYGALAGHGYYPLIAALWLILAIVASGLIVTNNEDAFTPTSTNKATWKTPPPITGAAPCPESQNDPQDRASCLNPVLYALDNALPGAIATGQAGLWTANGAQGVDAWIPYTLSGLKIASWIFVALLLAGVTGLLRKT